jgi:hypothetical protein
MANISFASRLACFFRHFSASSADATGLSLALFAKGHSFVLA